jgi:hypothetical protein
MDSCTATSPFSSSLTAINVAVECNNVGCDLLARDDAASAIETFSLALQLMRTISQVRVDPHVCVNLVDMASQSHCQIRQVVQSAQKSDALHISPFNKIAARSIKMNFVRSTETAVSTPFLNKNSTILLYNMGLACLVHGTPPMLSKSLPLFDIAYKLGVDTAASSQNDHLDGQSTLQRICMDSLHFSAQLYHTNSEFEMAEKLLVELRHLISHFPSTHDPQEQARRHHFWLLKDLLQKPSLAPAA